MLVHRLEDKPVKAKTARPGCAPPPSTAKEVDRFLGPHVPDNEYLLLHVDGEQCFPGAPKRLKKPKMIVVATPHKMHVDRITCINQFIVSLG